MPDPPAPLRAVIADDEPPARRRLQALLDEVGGVEVIAECSDGMEAVVAIEEGSPDVVFLDVRMPGLSGFQVVDAVGVQRMPPVVFGTGYGEYAVQAFEVHAADYLMKPFDRERLELTLDRVRTRIAESRPTVEPGGAPGEASEWAMDRIPVRTGATIRILDTNQILHLEADGNHVRIHTGEGAFQVRGTLKGFEERLDPRHFVRVHRGAIVRIDAVKELEHLFHGEYVLTLSSGLQLRSSRGYREALHAALNLDRKGRAGG